MPNLVVDIGNTFIKSAVFDEGEIVWSDHFQTAEAGFFAGLIARYKVDKVLISTVKKGREEWANDLANFVLLKYFDASMATAVSNHYTTPDTLGLDRLAAIVGARTLFPDIASLVIDAGTCITYDGIDEYGNYFGGSISPGINMRYKALNYYTDSLPLVQADEDFNDRLGDSTVNAIRSGVQNGVLYEALGFIDSYAKTYTKLNIILTGGDSIFFDTLLKNSIFAPCIKIEPYLVLKGLNAAIQRDND
jgi:type III pantothenate kinase